jgi:hypothetical protein
MRRLPVVAAAVAWCVLGLPRPAGSAPTVTLTVSTATISFADANPDLVPLVTGTPAPVTITVRVSGNGQGNWLLTIAANDLLRSGPDTIGVNNITWVASGPPFQAGTLALAPGQTVASGTKNANDTGTVTFRLANLWTYAPGNYTTTATFTLTAP